jgi:hypothetical protein
MVFALVIDELPIVLLGIPALFDVSEIIGYLRRQFGKKLA